MLEVSRVTFAVLRSHQANAGEIIRLPAAEARDEIIAIKTYDGLPLSSIYFKPALTYNLQL